MISGAALIEHVEFLTSVGPRCARHPGAVVDTLAYLADALEGFGYSVVAQSYGSGPHQVNLLAQLTGHCADLPILEVGAHWDSVPGSPGADDNASGVAGVLEVARCLREVGPPARSVRFCLFAEEEPEPGMVGSTAHVELLAGQAVDGLIALEMIGYRSREPGSQSGMPRVPGMFSSLRVGDFVSVVADRRSDGYARAFRRGAARCAPQLRVVPVRWIGGMVKDAARSDHSPYWRSGRKGLLVTGTANLRNPHYHLATDMPQTLDYAFLTDVARAVAGTVSILAG
ncbi:MAG TPA: M20/M25/M40 family metallo-hydrolase [Actinocrinis sp.]|nr:M20/M25/M40 family metallo-hydrolase [Actinocrinis sp.]